MLRGRSTAFPLSGFLTRINFAQAINYEYTDGSENEKFASSLASGIDKKSAINMPKQTKDLPQELTSLIDAWENFSIPRPPLNLSNQGIWSQHIPALIARLQQFDMIPALDLSRNNINDCSCELLGALANVQEIDLSYNDITATGLKKMVVNPTIKKLVLNRNPLGEEGGKILLNTKQVKLMIDEGTNIPPDLQHQIQQQVAKNSQISLFVIHAAMFTPPTSSSATPSNSMSLLEVKQPNSSPLVAGAS